MVSSSANNHRPVVLLLSTLFFLLLLPLIFSPADAHRGGGSKNFIRSSCRSTRYPDLCEECLSSYAPAVGNSPRQLAHAALSVSASRARSASSFVGRLSDPRPNGKSPHSRGGGAGAVKDCLDTLAEALDSLRRSERELSNHMGRRGSARYSWHLSNVQTWVSAAMTDENTCMDSLSEDSGVHDGVRGEIRKRIMDVARVTSNALALINRLQARNN